MGADGVERPVASRTQHAIRLLTLLSVCGEQTVESDPPGMARVIRAELRLQALDFWLRNPDYLAHQLVEKVGNGELGANYLDVAETLLNSAEPDLRWYPMPRWHYGAYEEIDDAFSLLETYGLARLGRLGNASNTVRSDFYITEAGMAAVGDIATDQVLRWYHRQAQLVDTVAGDDLGSTLKDRQYKQAEYAQTELGVQIAPIRDRVRTQLASLIADRDATRERDDGTNQQQGDSA